MTTENTKPEVIDSPRANVLRVTVSLDIAPSDCGGYVIVNKSALEERQEELAQALNSALVCNKVVGGYELATVGNIKVLAQGVAVPFTKEDMRVKVEALMPQALSALRKRMATGEISDLEFADAYATMRTNLAAQIRDGLGQFRVVGMTQDEIDQAVIDAGVNEEAA